MKSVIKTKDLTKYYQVKKQKFLALDKLNIEVKKSEIFGLLGTNGAGKTTTIKMLSTLLIPTSGTAQVLGFDTREKGFEVRKRIGVVFGKQMIYYRLTGWDNLQFYGTLYDIKDLNKKITELAKFFEIEDRIHDRLETYSNGMKTKLAIIRGIIHDPPLLFLDEPTLGLDPNIALKIRDKIKDLSARGQTIVLTTHYMIEAEHLCDRVGILHKGKLVAIDTPKKLKKAVPGVKTVEFELNKPEDAYKIKEKFVLSDDKTTVIVFIKSASELNKTVKRILDYGVSFQDIRLKEPSLEEVFAYHTTK